MKRRWNPTELDAYWCLTPDESVQLRNKTGATRLGFALLLKSFLLEGRFPTTAEEIPEQVVTYVAEQVDVPPAAWHTYPWNGASIVRHRAAIRKWARFREATTTDCQRLESWLLTEILPKQHRYDHLRDAALHRLRKQRIEPPAPDQLKRIIRAAMHAYEEQFSRALYQRLSAASVMHIIALLTPMPVGPHQVERTPWMNLKADPGRVGLDTILLSADRVRQVRAVGLPDDLFRGVAPQFVERLARKAAVEEPFELRRHSPERRATMIAAFLSRRAEELTDSLVDLLVEIIHSMGKNAERKVEQELAGQFTQVPGKLGVLVRIAEASLAAPEDTVKRVIFPVASEKILQALVLEQQSTGSVYQQTVRTVLKRSYSAHYRRMLPDLLDILEFKCGNTVLPPNPAESAKPILRGG